MDTPVRDSSVKWACSTCGKSYGEERALCELDGAPLVLSPVDSFIGKVFAERYEILARLGRGGMSTVYKARHILLDKIVAIKLMHLFLMTEANHVKRFQVEAKATSSLSHPNLISVSDFGVSSDGIPFIVMEFVEGQTLGDLLKKQRFLRVERCLDILTPVLEGLDHAHKQGIVHRDIKPGNIMLTQNADGSSRSLVVDFGIAKLVNSEITGESALTATGDIWGSPAYMSPEQCSGKGIDHRSDIYAMGCVLYQCLAGRLPFEGGSAIETIAMQANATPEPIHVVCPESDVPPLIEDVIMKALEKHADKRYASSAEFASALQSAFDKSKEQEAMQYLSARLQSRFKRFIKKINQNLLAIVSGIVVVSASLAMLITFNPDCRRFAHTAVNPSLYALYLLSGEAISSWNFGAAENLLKHAVQEADYGAVTDNRINSRDHLQKLYGRYGRRSRFKEVDAQIKSIKSEWLASKLSVKMSDEDKLSLSLLEKLQFTSDPQLAQSTAETLGELSVKSLKRGAYKLAVAQSSKAIRLWDEVMNHRGASCLRDLETMTYALEKDGDLKAALLAAEKLLNWTENEDQYAPFRLSAELMIARIKLMQNDSVEAEKWYSKAIKLGQNSGPDCTNILKDAILDYSAFLRRFGRHDEAARWDAILDNLEKSEPSKEKTDRTNA